VNQSKVALVVGISAYPKGGRIGSLKYASKDAELMRDVLKSQGYEVRFLGDSEAIGKIIENNLRDLSQAAVAPDGTLLFFFAGHGYNYQGTNYLAPFELTADDLAKGLPIQAVESLLLASKAKRKVMFVDACRNKVEPGSRAVSLRSFENLQTSEGIRELYSTKMGRLSYEYDPLGHGVFTYFLAKGIAGEAAADDGLVTFRDLADFVTVRVQAYTIPNGTEVQVPFEGAGGESNETSSWACGQLGAQG